jgi:hypothetical protein
MDTKSNFKLIDGEFSADEAKTILMSLINNKIDFHNLFTFSNHIRFNKDPEASKKRIEELMKSREDIIELTKVAQLEGYSFQMKSTVEIELVKNPVAVS